MAQVVKTFADLDPLEEEPASDDQILVRVISESDGDRSKTVTFDNMGISGKYPSLDLFAEVADEAQIVPVNIPQSTFDASTTDIGAPTSSTRTYLLASSLARSRQEGRIEKIECRAGAGSFANVTSLKVQVWRRTTSGYDLVGESEDVQSMFSGATENDVLTRTLSTPIDDVQAGDYIGVEAVTSGTASGLYKGFTGSGTHAYYLDGAIGTTAVDFEGGTTNPLLPLFRCYMKAPWGVYIGSSYGLSGQDGFWTHSLSGIDVDKQIAYRIQSEIERSIQNNSRNSTTTAANLVAEIAERVTDFKAKVVVLELGTNDLGGELAAAAMKADYITAIDAIIAAGSKCVCIGIAPRQTVATNDPDLRSEYNAAIRDIVSTRRTDAIFVDMEVGFGKSRAGGARFNRNDIRDDIDLGDGIHYTVRGWTLMANRIVAAIFGEPEDKGHVVTYQDAAGTDEAVDAGTTKTTPGTVDAWVKVEIDSVTHYIPAYASKTT